MRQMILLTLIMFSSVSVQASWFSETWQDTKDAASSAWESVSDKSGEVKEDVADSKLVEDAKKLGEKETYVNTWESMKESLKNPLKPNTDEFGLPKE